MAQWRSSYLLFSAYDLAIKSAGRFSPHSFLQAGSFWLASRSQRVTWCPCSAGNSASNLHPSRRARRSRRAARPRARGILQRRNPNRGLPCSPKCAPAAPTIRLGRVYPVLPLENLRAMMAQHVIDEVHFFVESDQLLSFGEVFVWCDEEGVCSRVASTSFRMLIAIWHWSELETHRCSPSVRRPTTRFCCSRSARSTSSYLSLRRSFSVLCS